MSVSIRVVTQTLTDKSKVFDVVLNKDGTVLRFPCYDRRAANRFADVLLEQINELTTEKADGFGF